MSNTELLIRLRDLHEELSAINYDLKSGEQVDEETVDALGQLVTDVNELVDRAKESMDDADDSQQTMGERHDMLDRIMSFETKHPRVTKFLSELTDLLAMMGI